MAAKKQGIRPKRIPQRICILCREPGDKRALIRLVRTTDGIEVDLTGKKPGRGAYLCHQVSCWHSAMSTNRIGQALRTKLSVPNQEELVKFMNGLMTDHE